MAYLKQPSHIPNENKAVTYITQTSKINKPSFSAYKRQPFNTCH